MSNETFKIKNGLTLTPVDLTSLTNPQAGDLACDINDLNKIKRYDANSLGWTEVGSGGVGNVNALLTQTFDTAALAQFTQTGLALTTSNPIDGTQSARLIHQAASSQSFKQVIAVDRKYRGDLMAMSLQVRSSATSGNLTLLVTDETNSAVIMASSSISTGQYQVATAVTNSTTTISGFSNVDINLLKVGMTVTGAGIPTATVISSINTAANTIVISQAATASATITAKFSALPDRKSFSFVIPTNCASLSYTFTALQEAGLPESYVDDVVIELANVSLLETSVTVPNLTAWQGYTPTFQGFGTPSAVEFEWRQVGENVEIRGKFTSGTPTVVEARIGLPNGLSSAGTGIIPSIQLVGTLARNVSTTTTVKRYTVIVDPSVSYLNIGLDDYTNTGGPLSKRTADVILNSGEVVSFTASVPCAGLSASSSVSIPLTQSGLVQEADEEVSYYGSFSGTAGFGTSTFTSLFVRRFASLVRNFNSSVQVSDSTANGAVFTVTKSAIYNISYSDTQNGAIDGVHYILIDAVIKAEARTAASAGNYSANLAWSGYLTSGQVVRFAASGASITTSTNTGEQYVSISRQGSLKQVSVNTNSKITIPTSELRFEGASTRGSTDTAIVKFDTQAKIRGDAFSVVNTAANGTVITMLKAGKLSVSATLLAAGAFDFFLSRNQATLTSASLLASEVLAGSTPSSTGYRGNATWTGDVVIGDVIRVASNSASTANATNNLNLSFQEQEIQVSVSNTLPQFSESDTSLRLFGTNGYGSINTTTRRFASTIQNIGTDIEYIDSTTLGGQFIAKAAGIYSVSFSEQSNANLTVMFVAIRINGSDVAVDNQVYNTAAALNKTASTSWQGYLNVGDIVTAAVNAAAENNGLYSSFTISKVGKPNVTGVNVTPFVNVPQPVSQSSFLSQSLSVTNTTITGALLSNSNTGIFSYNSSTGVYTVLKNSSISISASISATAAAAVVPVIQLNGQNIALSHGPAATNQWATTSFSGEVKAGSTFNVYNASTNASNSQVISVLATASADTILTAPETFSTDTASLQYASSSTYTLSTLANAPVGTFITFTYAINTNTRTQTTTAPTQTTADMNANGMLIYTAGFNTPTTAASPAIYAIQIGKGLKGTSLNLYKAVGKSIAGNIDLIISGTNRSGLDYGYNEVTGILIVDARYDFMQTSSNAGTAFRFSDATVQGIGYLVVNASKNPSILGLGLGTVAARGVSTSGQSIPNTGTNTMLYDAVKTYDTTGSLNSATGIFTTPESGYYQASWSCLFPMTSNLGQVITTILYKNGAAHSVGAYNTMDRAVPIDAGSTGSCGVYLAKGDTVQVVIVNNRAAGATALSATLGYNYFSIHKTSLSTGN